MGGSGSTVRPSPPQTVRPSPGSGTMSQILPRSKAKGTDVCATNDYYYIIRSDLGCYMQTSDLNKGTDISIFSLHPDCQNGDHYIGQNGYFHIIKGHSCHRVANLSVGSDIVEYSLHPNCRGGDHYFAAHTFFYIVFQEEGTLRVTTDMNLYSDAKELNLDPKFKDGLYYWGLQLKAFPPELWPLYLIPSPVTLILLVSKTRAGFCSFSVLKPASEWGVEFCTGPDPTKDKHTLYTVHPDVLNFLPGGLSVTKGPATGRWENIKTIENNSSAPVKWQKKITKKVGYNKEKMTQITHNWKIAASASVESGELAALIAKFQLSLSLEYGGSHVSTENESWNEATEVEELLDIELNPNESLYLWQYKLDLGQESVLFCRDLKITNDPNPPTESPLPPAQP